MLGESVEIFDSVGIVRGPLAFSFSRRWLFFFRSLSPTHTLSLKYARTHALCPLTCLSPENRHSGAPSASCRSAPSASRRCLTTKGQDCCCMTPPASLITRHALICGGDSLSSYVKYFNCSASRYFQRVPLSSSRNSVAWVGQIVSVRLRLILM